MRDKQGVLRGRCTQCNCPEYITPQDKVRCQNCNHAPTKHESHDGVGASYSYAGQGNNVTNNSDYYDTKDDVQWEGTVNLPSVSSSHFSSRPANVGQAWEDDREGPYFPGGGTFDNSGVLLCEFPGCSDTRDFDLNTRQYTSQFCYNHLSTGPITRAPHIVPSFTPQADPSFTSQADPSFTPQADPSYTPQADPSYTPQADPSYTPQADMIVNHGKTCGLPGCGKPCYIEQNGTIHDYCCKSHATAASQDAIPHQMIPPQPIPQPVPTAQTVPFAPSVPGASAVQTTPAPFTQSVPGAATNTMTVGGVAKCAIPECPNPCFVDAQGKAFECCGYTHAMELQRRKALAEAPVVKGVTHCLLPECNNLVWPFMNYCGRSHADLGKQRGLQPPVPQDDQSTKPANCCIIPGCRKNKYQDANGTVHPYCGKMHADQGKKLGIFPRADQGSDQCDLPGCTRPKRKEQDGTVHDYCCRDHATQDAPNRDAKILTPRSEVDKYLQKFGNLKVVKIEENSHAKPGGALFAKFKSKYLQLPKHQRTTQLAFHGTAEANIQNICTNGFDASRRSGQAYGAGEYFAVSPNIPLGYCKGGKKMLLNELLLGQQGTHHTRHGDIVVMKDPAHDLPRFVITFQ